MSTPVSVDSPAPSIWRKQYIDPEQEQRELQERVKYMIDLQYEQQQHNSATANQQGASSSSQTNQEEMTFTSNMTKRTKFGSTNLQALQQTAIDDDDNNNTNTDSNSNHDGAKKEPPAATSSSTTANTPSYHEAGVGKGTLYFSNEYKSNVAKGAANTGYHYVDSNSSSIPSSNNDDIPTNGSIKMSSLPSNPPQQEDEQEQQNPSQKQSAYGVGLVGTTSLDHHQQQQQQQQQELQLQQQSYQQQQQQHGFHYGNPDYHDPYHHDEYEEYENMTNSIGRRSRPGVCCAKCCAEWFCCCFLQREEHLRRSFCYGAIDGMLTGSGIVSAFCGMNILTSSSSYELRLAIVCFSFAACVADSICMAIGHVWTSFVVSSHHAEDRCKERFLLTHQRANAKSKLVDLLLDRGMLKIDAMSLADTLEGYPDLFVSTLVGDSLVLVGGASGGESGGESGGSNEEDDGMMDIDAYHGTDSNIDRDIYLNPDDNMKHNQHDYGAGTDPVSGSPMIRGGPQNNRHHLRQRRRQDRSSYGSFGFFRHITGSSNADGGSGGFFGGGGGGWKFPSYAREINELDDDPDEGNVTMVVAESQREGLFMMLGFATFAVIPSLLWLILPYVVPSSTLQQQQQYVAGKSSGNNDLYPNTIPVNTRSIPVEQDPLIALPSLVVSVTAIIMWTLGVWKSRFSKRASSSSSLDDDDVDSMKWMMFGVETVVVLLVCVLSSYSVGSALSYCFLMQQGGTVDTTLLSFLDHHEV